MSEKVQGYVLLFRDAQHPDIDGQYFTKDTDFGEIEGKRVPLKFGPGGKVIGDVVLWTSEHGVEFGGKLKTDLTPEEVAGFVHLRDSGALYGVAAAESTEAVSIGTDGKIERWPLAEVVLTKTPADPWQSPIVSVPQFPKPDEFFIPFAESAFNAYRDGANAQTWDMRLIPEWTNLGERLQARWVAAVKDVFRKLRVRAGDDQFFVTPTD